MVSIVTEGFNNECSYSVLLFNITLESSPFSFTGCMTVFWKSSPSASYINSEPMHQQNKSKQLPVKNVKFTQTPERYEIEYNHISLCNALLHTNI